MTQKIHDSAPSTKPPQKKSASSTLIKKPARAAPNSHPSPSRSKDAAALPPIQKKVRVVLKKRPNAGAPGFQNDGADRRGTQPLLRRDRPPHSSSSASPSAPPYGGPASGKTSRDRYQGGGGGGYRGGSGGGSGAPSRGYQGRGARRGESGGGRREYDYKEFVERRKREESQYKRGRPGGRSATAPQRVANPVPKSIKIIEGVTVNELARKMNLKGGELVSKLLSMGIMAGLNEKIDIDTTVLLAAEYSCTVEFISLYDETQLPESDDEEAIIEPRPPVVTVMGHVDHGKTTLLDAIRESNVTASESGGITQHIAAYQIVSKGKSITFIDTPGHEAFTLMRSRGAHLTDIVVLVVGGDDGLMPQTKEAIDHAKEAKVPIIVAVNKIDLESSNVERTKQQLSDYGLVPEEWGGEVICCPISALTRDGIPDLLDAILVNAEELELRAASNGRAKGKILESRIDHGRGIICTVLVQRGVLHAGDSFLAGIYFGKVRAMFDDTGQKIEAAGPSKPVEVLGFNEIPNAGDPFQVASSEKEARIIGGRRQELEKIKSAKEVKTLDINNIYESIEQQAQSSYKIILKGDVDGSVEAIKTAIERIQNEEIRVEVIRSAVGDINSNDVLLASASDAIIIGFHVRPSTSIQRLAEQEEVEIRRYTVIYKVLEDLEEQLLGLQKPKYNEVEIGTGEVRTIFSVSKVGTIAGSFVSTGKIKRDCIIELFRGDKQVHRGMIAGLKRFKNDAKEVDAGYECGVTIENFNAIEEGDTFKVIEAQQVR